MGLTKQVPDGRKCKECNKLEDEFHLLLECSLYNDLRKQYPIKRRVTKASALESDFVACYQYNVSVNYIECSGLIGFIKRVDGKQ